MTHVEDVPVVTKVPASRVREASPQGQNHKGSCEASGKGAFTRCSEGMLSSVENFQKHEQTAM